MGMEAKAITGISENFPLDLPSVALSERISLTQHYQSSLKKLVALCVANYQ